MARAAAVLGAAALAGCSSALPAAAPPPLHGAISLDYCADQMVLGLLPKAQVRAVSPEADTDVGFSAPRAVGIPRLRPALEEIAALRPRYVVRSYGGAPGIDRQLSALGITVVQLGYVSRLDDVPAELRRVGGELNASPRAASLADTFSATVARARSASSAPPPTLLYITPGDVTTGRDSFVGDLITGAGFQSVRTAPGWGSLPLEDMVRRPPDATLRAFFDNNRHRQDRWSSSLHPRLRQLTAKVPSVAVRGSALACANWLAGDALRQLADLRRQMSVAP
jgi:iron complex transport system substrate-binding protein